MGLGSRMGGDAARTADLTRLKKYSTPYNITPSNQTGVGVIPKLLLVGDWLGIGLLVNNCLCFFIFFSPYLVNELHLYECFGPFTALYHSAAGTE